MKIKQIFIMLALLIFSVCGFLITSPVGAKAGDKCGDDSILEDGQNCCGGVVTSLISCDQTGGDSSDITNTGLWGILLLAINILTAGVGIAAVGGLIYGSILYTSAGGTPEGVKKAHTIIQNVVIGIVMYALLYSLLNFLIPGGIFN